MVVLKSGEEMDCACMLYVHVCGCVRVCVFVYVIKLHISLIACGSYLGLWDEGSSRDGEAALDSAQVLGHDGQTAPLSAPCTGC